MKKVKNYIKENKGFVVFVILIILIRAFLFDWYTVPSGSMNPTLIEGDRIFTSKIEYGLRIPFTKTWLWQRPENVQRGQIVVFTSPEDGITLVKRLVGMPGDKIKMVKERLYINGKPIDYTDLSEQQQSHLTSELIKSSQEFPHFFIQENLLGTKHNLMVLPTISAKRNFDEITIPQGKYLMLGDNRDNSRDSRYIGLVPQENLIAPGKFIFFSLPKISRSFMKFEQ
jgi:signal peptidase I